MPNARRTAEMHLREAGFLVFFDSATGLWQIDLPLDDSLFTTQSIQPCPFPQKDSLHPVYALYRLLTSHPSPVEQQPAELLRGLLKCTAFPPDEIKPRITQLTGQCAALLNRKQLLPAAACYALNQYICQEDSK